MSESVYKIHNNMSSDVYIGCSKDPYNRFYKHQSSLRNHRHTSKKFQSLYDECKDNLILRLEVVETHEDAELARKRELELLTQSPNLLNTKIHSAGGDMISNHVKNSEFRDMQRVLVRSKKQFTVKEGRPGSLNPNYRHGKCVKGRKCPKCDGYISLGADTCAKCYDKHGESNPFYGKTHSEKVRKVISEKLTGRINERDRKKISVNGVIYDSLTIASQSLNIPMPTLSYQANRDSYPNVFYLNKEEMPND